MPALETQVPVQPKSEIKAKLRKAWQKHGVGYLMFAPFVILFTIFVVVPIVSSVFLSFTQYNMLQPPKWVGLRNFEQLFLEDDVFLIALKNTILFAVISGPLGFMASFLFAWIIDQLKARNVFSLAFYAPSLTSGVAMSIVWLYFFSSDRYGLINNFLINTGLIDEPLLWTMNPKLIMPVILIISIWMSMGTGFLVFLAGFQNISTDLYEAGSIDGIRNRFQELWYITIPSMKPQLLFGAVNSVTTSLAVFDIAVSVAGMPSPNYAGHTLVAHLYDHAFIRFNTGYASAVAVVLFALTFTLGRIFMKLFATDNE